MKLSLIAACLVMTGCAVGSGPETDSTPEVVTKIPPPKPTPTPVESPPSGQSECIIDSYWVQNCLVVEILCKGKPPQIEVACGPGRRLWPWEIHPYPPPYDVPENRL